MKYQQSNVSPFSSQRKEMEKLQVLFFLTLFCMLNVLVCQGFKIMSTPPKTTDADLTTKSSQHGDSHQHADNSLRSEEKDNDDADDNETRYRQFPIQRLVQVLIRECSKLLRLLHAFLSILMHSSQEEGTVSQTKDNEMAMEDVTTKRNVILTHAIRIKRSTTSESSESSTLSNSTQHTSEGTSNSENRSDLQIESLISSKTLQTENGSLHPTTITTATKSTTIMFNQSNENGKDIQCPLWLYSGNDSKTKLYGMLEKPCCSDSFQELDQDFKRHYIRLYEERLYETIDMTEALINSTTEKKNSDLVKELKNVDFNCFVSRSGQENQTSVEEQSSKLHHSLLKSYAILDVLISKENETEIRDKFILGEVSELKKRIRQLVCYIEKLLRKKCYSIDSFPLFSKRDGNFNFFDNSFELSLNFYVYIHQVFKYLRESAVNEAKVLWSLV